MADTAFENAKARHNSLISEKSKIEQRLKEIQAEMRDVESFMVQWRRFAYEPHISPSPVVPDMDSKGEVAAKNPKKEFVAERAREIIDEIGSPLSRLELFKELEKRGIVIYGKDPEMVLSTMLWRMKDKIVRLDPYGYWLRERPFAPARYDPTAPAKEEPQQSGVFD